MKQSNPQCWVNSALLLTVLACIAAVLSGCAISSYPDATPGRLIRSMEIERVFNERTLLPDHDYYYLGSENDPDAILAVSRSIRFHKGMWSDIALTQNKLNYWMLFIDGDTSEWNCTWYGQAILTPDGQRVGLLYSKYTNTTPLFPEPDLLVLYPPSETVELFFGRPNCWDD